MAITDEEILEPVSPPSPPSPDDGWRTNKAGRHYIPRQDGRAGVILREGGESIEEARERDSKPKDQAPKRKRAKPKMPAAPKKVDLKALEEGLAAALKTPGAVAMSFGDEWGFEHFNMSGPYLARQLVLASEFNPWLRRKLEEAATGEEAMMKIVGIMGISGALFAYVVPPVVYYFNLPVPDKAREMWHVPPRRDRMAPNAFSPPPAPDPEPA